MDGSAGRPGSRLQFTSKSSETRDVQPGSGTDWGAFDGHESGAIVVELLTDSAHALGLNRARFRGLLWTEAFPCLKVNR